MKVTHFDPTEDKELFKYSKGHEIPLLPQIIRRLFLIVQSIYLPKNFWWMWLWSCAFICTCSALGNCTVTPHVQPLLKHGHRLTRNVGIYMNIPEWSANQSQSSSFRKSVNMPKLICIKDKAILKYTSRMPGTRERNM